MPDNHSNGLRVDTESPVVGKFCVVMSSKEDERLKILILIYKYKAEYLAQPVQSPLWV